MGEYGRVHLESTVDYCEGEYQPYLFSKTFVQAFSQSHSLCVGLSHVLIGCFKLEVIDLGFVPIKELRDGLLIEWNPPSVGENGSDPCEE